jgi:hypothetical protein
VDGASRSQLTDAVGGRLRGVGRLIVDRNPLHTTHFKRLLAETNVEPVRRPARSPNLSALAERFVRSVKDAYQRHAVPLGERHLFTVICEYVEHSHVERNHQGLDDVTLFPSSAPQWSNGPIARRERLGGLLTFYERKAAQELRRSRIGKSRHRIDEAPEPASHAARVSGPGASR